MQKMVFIDGQIAPDSVTRPWALWYPISAEIGAPCRIPGHATDPLSP